LSDGAALEAGPVKLVYLQSGLFAPKAPYLVPKQAFERSVAGPEEQHVNFILRQQRVLLN
jgi:hypothetical protein